MEEKDFSIFCILMSDVYAQAFHEPLSRLRRGKALTLSWIIFEATGEMLSYKTLLNYVQASLEGTPHKIHPTDGTLSILARFATGQSVSGPVSLAWYRYRRMVNRE